MKKYVLTILFVFVILLQARPQVFEWAQNFGGSTQDEGRAVATDADGNVYTTGTFRYTADFDPDINNAVDLVSAGDDEIFVQKLDEDGDLVWAIQLGGTGWEGSRAIAVDGSGNVYVAGNFNGTADFNPASPATFELTSAGDDIFVVKLNSAGALVWAKQMGGATTDEAYSVAVDGSGNVYLTGRFQGTADFDPGANNVPLVASGSSDDIFICKLNSLGDYVWAKGFGDGGNDFGLSIAVDASGNVYTTGYFYGTVDFDPGNNTVSLQATGGSDIYINKLNAAGDFVWANRIGDVGWDIGYSLVLDGSGNIYTTGRYEGTTDFNPDNVATLDLISNGYQDIYIAKYTNAGAVVWAKGIGSGAADWGSSIDIDNWGDLYFTGFFQGTTDFDPSGTTTDLVSVGNEDIFISKFDDGGNLLWAQSMGGDNSTFGDRGQSIAVDPAGNVYTTGWFYGSGDFEYGAGTTPLTSLGSFDIFVHRLSQLSISITENENNELAVYPNPTTGELHLNLANETNDVNVVVKNTAGQTVFTQSFSPAGKISFSIEGAAGIYFVDVNAGAEKTKRFKVVKQ